MPQVDLFFREKCDLTFYSWARDCAEKKCGEIIVIPALVLYEFVKPIFESIANLAEHLFRLNEDPKLHSWNALKEFGCFVISPLIGSYKVLSFIFSRVFDQEYEKQDLYKKRVFETLNKITKLYKQEFKANNCQFRILEENSIDQLFLSLEGKKWGVTIGISHHKNRKKDPSELLPYVKKYLSILPSLENELKTIQTSASNSNISEEALERLNTTCQDLKKQIFEDNSLENLQQMQERMQSGELKEFLKNELLICFGLQILIDAMASLKPFSNSFCEDATQEIFNQLANPLQKRDLSQFEEITKECDILAHFSDQIQHVVQVELKSRKEWEKFEALNKEDLANYSCLEATHKVFSEWTIMQMSCHKVSRIEKLNREDDLNDQLESTFAEQKRKLSLMREVFQIKDLLREIFSGLTFSTFNLSNLNKELGQLFELRLVNKAWSSSLPLPKDYFFSKIQKNRPNFAQELLKLKKICKNDKLIYRNEKYLYKNIENILIFEKIPIPNENDVQNIWFTHLPEGPSRKFPMIYEEGLPYLQRQFGSSNDWGLFFLREERKLLLKKGFIEQRVDTQINYNLLLPLKLLMQMGEPALQKL